MLPRDVEKEGEKKNCVKFFNSVFKKIQNRFGFQALPSVNWLKIFHHRFPINLRLTLAICMQLQWSGTQQVLWTGQKTILTIWTEGPGNLWQSAVPTTQRLYLPSAKGGRGLIRVTLRMWTLVGWDPTGCTKSSFLFLSHVMRCDWTW